jgi:hypothetical protein
MLDQITIQEFSQTLSQPLIMPFDSGYDEGRSVWNGMVDKRPAMIAKCINVDDIKKCVNFAQGHDLLVSIKGGGHNVAGRAVCDDGLMINLSQMNAVIVDPVKRTVRVESGATICELDKETQKFGLATPVGIVSKTGIAGLTLGGGIGYLGRKHGLTIDNLLSVELVTAKGNLISASETENSDLFWAHIPGPLSAVGFEPFGGAITRVEESATAFPQRSASYVLGLWSGWIEAEDDEKIINWTRELYNKMTPFASGGAYSNYLDNDDNDKISASFGSNYSRLQDVKNKYDTNNFFKLNQNIIPNPDL